MNALILLNRSGALLAIKCNDQQLSWALSYGTAHNEKRRAYGLIGHRTIEQVAAHYVTKWQAKSVTCEDHTNLTLV